jgi:HlyD family secretion protein
MHLTSPTHLRARRSARALAALVTVSSLVWGLTGCGSSPALPSSVRVEPGSVDRTVSATGTLQPITEQRLGFSHGGRLVAVMVSPGQQVRAGEALARLDDFSARQELSEARARLSREQSKADRVGDGTKQDAAKDDADHAEDTLGAIRDRKDTVGESNDQGTDAAQQRLEEDRDSLREASREAGADQDRCNRSVTGGSHRYDGYGDYLDAESRDHKGAMLESPLDPKSPSCSRAERGKRSVSSSKHRIDGDERGVDDAQRRQDLDEASERVGVENAERDASSAGDAADTAREEHPHDVDEQRSNVSMARTEVRRAERALRDTTLTAPVAGTISSVNGQVGEFIDSGSGSTALAPGGGRTGLPDLSSSASSGSTDSSAGSQAAPPPPGAGALITLKNVNSFRIVAPFAESDAALVAPNQRVQVTFDAVPGLERDGTVGSISPTGAQVKDVNNYYATILLGQADPRLKAGMTAQAKVIVGGVDNTLVVPTAAIERAGATGTVEVLQPDRTTRRIQVQLGLQGDRTTQVISGLTEGQQVVVAPAG